MPTQKEYYQIIGHYYENMEQLEVSTRFSVIVQLNLKNLTEEEKENVIAECLAKKYSVPCNIIMWEYYIRVHPNTKG